MATMPHVPECRYSFSSDSQRFIYFFANCWILVSSCRQEFMSRNLPEFPFSYDLTMLHFAQRIQKEPTE